ncbi:response regulator transcription factor [Erysipelothrix sp. HDW6C]|uniref:response regulator transcription factor n=1 Tax=Erysipelothrix sp. HDW6C TaxID=2714930 RepID=UPI00140781D1|nr:response regulator transcription factor [Erysipelothrix sp. HDW6C]QIK70676.1 response regulator transcription factor [Erysipelothrix sp. HDW6C]
MKDRVLIVEDDSSIAELQKDYLEMYDYEVIIENDGQRGLVLALKETFDLIILDVMLPSLSGFEICTQIRKAKNTPIIFLSAKSEDVSKIKAFGMGADDYILKPFSPSELVARVKAHISRYKILTESTNTGDIIKYDNLTLDISAHKVTIDEILINLTSKEFALLAYILTNPNRVLSKEQIFEAVWDMESYDSNLSTVIVHMKRLREKLKNGGLSIFPIETIRGSGYRFNL